MAKASREYHREYMRHRRAGKGSVVEPPDPKYDELTWNSIEGFPGYEASYCGQIRSLKRTITRSNGRPHTVPARVLKQNFDSHGYYQVGLYCGYKKKRMRSVHKLVWEAFNGMVPPGNDVHHIDHDQTNNRLDNLEPLDRTDHANQFIEDLEQKAYERGYAACYADYNLDNVN